MVLYKEILAIPVIKSLLNQLNLSTLDIDFLLDQIKCDSQMILYVTKHSDCLFVVLSKPVRIYDMDLSLIRKGKYTLFAGKYKKVSHLDLKIIIFLSYVIKEKDDIECNELRDLYVHVLETLKSRNNIKECKCFDEYSFVSNLNNFYGNYKNIAVENKLNEKETVFLDLSSELEESSDVDEFSDPDFIPLRNHRTKSIHRLYMLKSYLLTKNVIQKHKNIKIYKNDLKTLIDSNWLNDKIINNYLSLLYDAYGKINNFYILTTYFYYNLKNNRCPDLAIDIFKFMNIFIPVHLTNHWVFVDVDIVQKRISVLDSLGADRTCVGNEIRKWIIGCFKEKGMNVNFDVKMRVDIPRQSNGNDCGVFVLHYARIYCKRKAMSGLNASTFRLIIMQEIWAGKIMYTG